MEKETLAENLLSLIPFLFKKLLKVNPCSQISRHQLEFLFLINKHDGKPMSFYSEKMMLPKSNITVLSDKMISDGLIEREFDQNDRRIINLKITDKGRESLCEFKQIVFQETIKKLSVFDENEVNRLNELVSEMQAIFKKIE